MLVIDSVEKEPALTGEAARELFLSEYKASAWKKILYVHLPYCPSKCKYCICKSRASSDPRTVQRYVREELIPQIEEVSAHLSDIRFDEVYFGGGTPTYADAQLLESVFDAIPRFDDIPTKCIEGSPNTITFDHLDLFKRRGFSFLSVGIQSLQENVCKWQNRFHLTHEQLLALTDAIKATGLYFNYDLICYMGAGDFRDNAGFEDDLRFLMEQCKPSSINVHQLHQTTYTTEKMLAIIRILRRAIEEQADYECINSRLLDQDAYEDIVHQAQYRLVRESRDFQHYMWNKYPEIPVKQYDIFSVGHTGTVSPKSNAGTLVYRPGRNSLKRYRFDDRLYDDFYAIRREKGLVIE